jgi:uncharacterized membrane protein
MAEIDSGLADHVQRSIEAIAAVHREHARRAGPLQRLIEQTTARLAQPAVITTIALAVVGWMGWNGWRAAHGLHPLDPPPFGWLDLLASLAGVGLATLILATQRRENLLEEQRSQLILELALQSDQKTAKLISLLEEFRRDSPLVVDRHDAESEAMSQPADTGAVLDAIQRQASEAPKNTPD